MKVVYEYSHLGGSEILQVRYPAINKEIYGVIAEINPLKLKKCNRQIMLKQFTTLRFSSPIAAPQGLKPLLMSSKPFGLANESASADLQVMRKGFSPTEP